MMSEIKLNLYQKIQAVADEVKTIEKNLIVGTGNSQYKAVGDLDVTLAVKNAESKHKIVSIPIKQDLVNSEVLRTVLDGGKEKITYVDTIKMTIRILDLEDVDKFIDIESFGKGVDSGDKGLGKAATYARKYGLLNAYKIATGEDPDADKSKEHIADKTPSETRILLENFLGKDTNRTNEVLKAFNVQQVGELNDEQVATVYAAYKQKKLV